MSLTVKDAIQAARTQFKELLPDLALDSSHKSVADSLNNPEYFSTSPEIRLEELERDGANWVVTLSAPNPDFKESDLLEGIRRARMLARVAKVIVIDGETGNLVALRERAA